MKITFIATVFNEEKNIDKFLESIKNQTKKPDEIVIADANSSDKTQILIEDFFNKNKKLNGKLLIEKGNRSVGRNIAIKNSVFEIIAVSDAGCVLDKNWLLEITEPFEKNKNKDVVAGFYKPIAKNIFEKCLSTYTCVMEDKIDSLNFLPSARSIAFKKNIFEKVGGYPEYLNTCEDLIFAKKLKKIGAKFYFNKNAMVYWTQRKNILETCKQFFSYAYGDGRALYFRKTTPFLFLRYLLGFIILFLAIFFKSEILSEFLFFTFILYLIWAVWKNYKYVKNIKAFFYLPVLQLVSDFCVLVGMTVGIASRLL